MTCFHWLIIISYILFAIPVLRLAVYPIQTIFLGSKKSQKIAKQKIWTSIGLIEYLIGPLRDRLLSLILLTWLLILLIFSSMEKPWLALTLVGIYLLLATLATKYRDETRLRMTEIARTQSNIHPKAFFNLYYQQLSLWPQPLNPQKFPKLSYEEADFRTSQKPKDVLAPAIYFLASTSTLARMAILAFKKIGPEFGRDAFDGLARIWSSRTAQIFKSHLKTKGSEQIPALKGKTLVLLNHNSYLDFVLNFFAMGGIRFQTGRQLRLRFIAAKDHFIDNKLIYSGIGLGKVIENAGMIFINRREKGKGWAAMQEAAQKLMENDVEIAIYPQGTRGRLLTTAEGNRLDSGFYSSFTKKSATLPLGHLKPGTASLILDSLIQLKQRGESQLNVILAGIQGAGRAAPRGTVKIRTQAEITFSVAPLWEIPASLAEGISAPSQKNPQNDAERLYLERHHQIQKQIHQKLIQALDWHCFLMKRAKEEMKRLNHSSLELEAVQNLLTQADQEGQVLPFMLIERILCLKPKLWDKHLKKLIGILELPFEEDEWKNLLKEVSEKLLHT